MEGAPLTLASLLSLAMRRVEDFINEFLQVLRVLAL